MIDQSGKIEDTNMNTGLAFSTLGNQEEGISECVHIKKEHKKRLKPLAKKSLGDHKKYQYKLFSCGIFMLTQNYLGAIDEIIIDQEYEGKDNLVKTYLWNFYDSNTMMDSEKFPSIKIDRVHNLVSGTPKCHDLSYKARELDVEPMIISDFRFLKGMLIPGAGNGRNT